MDYKYLNAINGPEDVRVFNYGFERKFYDGVNVKEVMEERRLTPELIYEDIM